jgi:putative hemolysin
MSEAAVIASRKARLQQLAEKGDHGARAALKLAEDPNRFLSTVQIGITLIGIMAGVFGGASIAESLKQTLLTIPALARYAGPLSFGIVILMTTYLSLIIGELAPKRLALQHPERIASALAGPMRTLSKLTGPVVTLLSKSTELVVWLLGVKASDDPLVTAEEITTMVQQGVEAGIFTEGEHGVVEGIFSLSDRRARAIMRPRTEIAWVNCDDSPEDIQRVILGKEYSRFLVCEGDLDHVLGLVHTHDLFVQSMQKQTFDLRAVMTDALFVPETMTASQVLEQFKANGQQFAVVLGEHGGVEGLITLQDLLNKILGGIEDDGALEVVEREDGSLLMDGMMPVDEFKSMLLLTDPLPGEREYFQTLGGFVMMKLGRVPNPADSFRWGEHRYEVMDMDGHRVDKVLVTRLPAEDGATETNVAVKERE